MSEEYFIVHFRFAYPRCRTSLCGIRKPRCYTPDHFGKKGDRNRDICRFRKYIECGKNSVIYDDEDEREADDLYNTLYGLSHKDNHEYSPECYRREEFGPTYLEFPPGYPPECLPECYYRMWHNECTTEDCQQSLPVEICRCSIGMLTPNQKAIFEEKISLQTFTPGNLYNLEDVPRSKSAVVELLSKHCEVKVPNTKTIQEKSNLFLLCPRKALGLPEQPKSKEDIRIRFYHNNQEDIYKKLKDKSPEYYIKRPFDAWAVNFMEECQDVAEKIRKTDGTQTDTRRTSCDIPTATEVTIDSPKKPRTKRSLGEGKYGAIVEAAVEKNIQDIVEGKTPKKITKGEIISLIRQTKSIGKLPPKDDSIKRAIGRIPAWTGRKKALEKAQWKAEFGQTYEDRQRSEDPYIDVGNDYEDDE